jgi:DNA-binding PadR family transcriptional regulator
MPTTLEHVSAYQKVIRRQITRIQPFDWQILFTLHELAKPSSLKGVLEYYTTNFHKAYNSRYYDSFKRLEQSGLINETKAKHGWGRRWRINNKGRIALNNLNIAAARLLKSSESTPAIAQKSPQ